MKRLIASSLIALALISLPACGTVPASHSVLAAPNATWPDQSEVYAINVIRKDGRALTPEEQGAFKSWFNRTVTLFCKLDFINNKSDEECIKQ